MWVQLLLLRLQKLLVWRCIDFRDNTLAGEQWIGANFGSTLSLLYLKVQNFIIFRLLFEIIAWYFYPRVSCSSSRGKMTEDASLSCLTPFLFSIDFDPKVELGYNITSSFCWIVLNVYTYVEPIIKMSWRTFTLSCDVNQYCRVCLKWKKTFLTK